MKKHIGLNILLLILAFSLHAQNFTTNSGCITNPPDFIKLSYEEASEAVSSQDDLIGRGAKKICPEYVTNLVNQLLNEQLSDDNKTLAIYLLGELHPTNTDAIEVLIENIDLKAAKLDPKTRIRRWGKYPAEEALIKIGKPVVNPILNHLPTESNELRQHLMCEVLRRVEGKEAAQNQIKEKLAAETDSSKKANLELALKELEKS